LKIGNSPWSTGIGIQATVIDAILGAAYISIPRSQEFAGGRTDVKCRVRSGGGYVTSPACEKAVCV
jgi:hypothetical protein